MNPRRGQVAARLIAAGAGAALALMVWELWLRDRDAEAWAQREARDLAEAGSASEAAPRPVVDRNLAVGTVVLCDAPLGVPEARVEWQLLSDSRLVQRRASPLPTSPGRVPVAVAAVVLPVRDLGELSPAARACLLDLLSSVWPERPVDPGRLQLQGIEGDRADCNALLSWLR